MLGAGPPCGLFRPLPERTGLTIFSEAEHLISSFPGLVLGPKRITRQSSGSGYFISSLADESPGAIRFWSLLSLVQGPHASSTNLRIVTTSGTDPITSASPS